MSCYRLFIRKHLLPFFGESKSVTSEDVQSFVNDRLASGLSVKTVKDLVTLLGGIVFYGHVRYGFPKEDWDVVFPRYPKKDVAVLSADEIRRLQAACKKEFSFKSVGVLLALGTGLRIGETSGLQWKDIDVKLGIVSVTKTVERIYVGGETRVVVGPPKSESSAREVPLPASLLSLFRPFKKVLGPETYIVSGGDHPCEPRLLRLYFYRLLVRNGIKRVGFHCLRHTFASRLVASGCDVKTVSALLGHSSVRTTLDRYVHPDMEQKRRAVNRLERMTR